MAKKVSAAPRGSIDPESGSRHHSIGSPRHRARIVIAASTAAVALVATAATANAAVLGSNAGTSAGAVAPRHIGSLGKLPKGAVTTGTTAAGTELKLSVTLAPRDPQALKDFITATTTAGNADYHHYLTKGQFASVFGPTQATIDQVVAALKSAGLHPGKVSADGLSIPVTATAAQASHAFGTGFSNVKLPSGAVAYTNTKTPSLALPADAAASVSSIVGLSDVTALTTGATSVTKTVRAKTPAAQSQATGAKATAQVSSECTNVLSLLSSNKLYNRYEYFNASTLKSKYGMSTSATAGAGVTVAVYELENVLPSNIAFYQSCLGTKVPVSYVRVDGGPTVPADNDDSGTDTGDPVGIESTLDIEDLIGLAPGVKIIDYEGPDSSNGTDTTELDTYQRIVNDDKAQVISSSWGACEAVQDPQFMASENTIFAEAAAQGQTVVAASGDSGSSDCYEMNNSSAVGVDDPAAQPYVTGAGGTTITPTSSTAYNETVWNNSAKGSGGAGGGGVSSVWSAQSYQAGYATSGQREVPDVSALADPFDGYLLYLSDTTQYGAWLEGGTSGAAPTWAAVIAQADGSAGCKANGAVGFANPALYQAARSNYSGAYQDITSGNNALTLTGYTGDLYAAKTGYDDASGLGSPHSAELTDLLCYPAASATSSASTFHSVSPQRLLDTRSSIGWGTSGTKVPSGGTARVQVEGNSNISGMPTSGVTAVVLNVTVTGTTGAGVLTAYGDHTKRPTTSNLNWSKAGQTISNLVTVSVPADGRVDLYTNSSTSVIADIQGYYTSDTTGATFTGVAPDRLLDTRNAIGIGTKTPITNGVVSLAVAGHGGVPADATAVVLNLTATGTTTSGYLEAYPEGDTAPGVSNVNWVGSSNTIAGLAIVPLGSDGNVSIKVNGTSQAIADVFGYFTADTTGSKFTAVAPTRLLDTRNAIGISTKTLIPNGSTIALQVTGKAGIPAGIKAVVLNVTVTQTIGAGVLTAWADGQAMPTASNLNWAKAQTIPNEIVVPVGTDGKVDLHVVGSTAVIADVAGYYL